MNWMNFFRIGTYVMMKMYQNLAILTILRKKKKYQRKA